MARRTRASITTTLKCIHKKSQVAFTPLGFYNRSIAIIKKDKTDIYQSCHHTTTDRGLEPLLTESESAVLPLHQSALFIITFSQTQQNILYTHSSIMST